MPVTIVGGFLGAGKTTLLNHLLGQAGSRRLGVIVNDFGSINIDASLVVGVDGDLVELSNGCICCSIRDDLVEGLERLLRVPEPPEHVLIEASGVSDPRGIARGITQQALRQDVTLDAVVVVVDVDHYLGLGRRERIVAGGQIVAGDILVLNKTDLVDEDALCTVEARIRRQSRRGRIVHASRGRVPLPLVLGVGGSSWDHAGSEGALDIHVHEAGGGHRHAHHGHEHGVEFWTWSFRSSRPLSSRRLRRAVNALPAAVVRAKGTVQLASHPQKRAVMHVVGRRAELSLDRPWGAEPPATGLVLIGSGDPLPPQELEAMFRACEVDPGEVGPGGAVMRWVRKVLPPREPPAA